MEPITLLVGAGLLAAGYAAGALPRRRRRTPDEPTEARCGCGHGLDQHDPSTNECHAQTARCVFDNGRWKGDEFVTCTCRQYTGPRPLEELFAPRYLPPTE